MECGAFADLEMSAPSTIFANLPELLRCLAEEVRVFFSVSPKSGLDARSSKLGSEFRPLN